MTTGPDESDGWTNHLRLYQQADARYQQGQTRSALKLFRAALSLAPGDADTLWAMADCYSDLAQPRKAERYYRLARACVPWSERGDLLYHIANALLDQGRLGAALSLYRRVPRSATVFDQARTNALRALRHIHRRVRASGSAQT